MISPPKIVAPPDSFHELLVARIVELESSDAEIARVLTHERGIDTSTRSVQRWSSGSHVPAPWKWSALLDVLGVVEPARSEWRTALELAARPRSPWTAWVEAHRAVIASTDLPMPSPRAAPIRLVLVIQGDGWPLGRGATPEAAWRDALENARAAVLEYPDDAFSSLPKDPVSLVAARLRGAGIVVIEGPGVDVLALARAASLS